MIGESAYMACALVGMCVISAALGYSIYILMESLFTRNDKFTTGSGIYTAPKGVTHLLLQGRPESLYWSTTIPVIYSIENVRYFQSLGLTVEEVDIGSGIRGMKIAGPTDVMRKLGFKR